MFSLRDSRLSSEIMNPIVEKVENEIFMRDPLLSIVKDLDLDLVELVESEDFRRFRTWTWPIFMRRFGKIAVEAECNMEDIDSEAIEIDSLENYLLQAEYIYKSDITLLQKALIRTKRIENLHLIGLQSRMAPILSKFIRLQLHCFFFKWKSEIFLESTYRSRKILRTLRFLIKKMQTRAFITFRERGGRVYMERLLYPGLRRL